MGWPARVKADSIPAPCKHSNNPTSGWLVSAGCQMRDAPAWYDSCSAYKRAVLTGLRHFICSHAAYLLQDASLIKCGSCTLPVHVLVNDAASSAGKSTEANNRSTESCRKKWQRVEAHYWCRPNDPLHVRQLTILRKHSAKQTPQRLKAWLDISELIHTDLAN